MRWQGRGESGNVEDRRGQGSSGFRGMALKGPGGIVIFLLVLVAGYYGIDLSPLLNDGSVISPGTQSEPYQASPEEEELTRFSSVALKMTEDSWGEIFQKMGRTYRPPKLVLYTGATSTTCGYGQSAMGPFYCPADESIYIDLSFYQDMKNRLGGGGDFAQGYVIAHEVGHHVQHLLGIDQQVRQRQQSGGQVEANRLSVKVELQADCLAGIWGKSVQSQGILDPGDVEQALNTAEAIGDDRLQQQSGGRVVPDSFTHGTSAQRYTWFRRGFDSGDLKACDTFSAAD